MRKMVDGILRQYGTAMTLEQAAGEKTVRGFFQPVRSKSWQNIVNAASALGEFSRRQYIYIGPAGTPVEEGNTLMLGERAYLFRRVEYYYYADEPVYIWGLCVEKGVSDTWGT